MTAEAKTYQIPEFTTDPPGCPVTYTYVVNPAAATAVLSFDDVTHTFTFFNDQDISIASDVPYGILITGTTGTVAPISADILPPFLPLTIKNPCVDPNFVSITPVSLKDQIYELTTMAPGFEWIHDAFEVTTVPTTHTFCGDINYSATFMGNVVDSTTSPLSYDSATRTFSIYTEDTLLIGVH